MINWNITPMVWSTPDFPYLLFSEMEWIGKLSYIATDHDTRITTIETETIPAITDRIDTIEDVTIPAINDRIDTIVNVTIPALNERVSVLEDATKTLLVIPTLYFPVDTTDTRTYTVAIPTGYDVCDICFNLLGDYTEDFGITSESMHNFSIFTDNGNSKESYFTNTVVTGEYGTSQYLFNDISVSVSNNTLTIVFGKECLFDSTNIISKTDFYGFPVINKINLKLYKLPTT